MLLWMLLLFCENGKLKKFQKFQNSKTEKNKIQLETIRKWRVVRRLWVGDK